MVPDKEKALLVIPEICADKIIELYHISLFAGHQGVIKTYLTISNILPKCLTGQGQTWHKFLSLATFAYNMFHTPNSGNYSPYELVFGRMPKILINIETDPHIKISGTYKDYHTLLIKRLNFLQNMLQNFKLKCLALLNKDKEHFQYNSGDLVYLISPLTTQLRTSSRKVAINYVGPLVVYKIVDPHNYLLMAIDGKLLRGLFEHKRLKPVMNRMDKGNVSTLSTLKRVMNLEIST